MVLNFWGTIEVICEVGSWATKATWAFLASSVFDLSQKFGVDMDMENVPQFR